MHWLDKYEEARQQVCFSDKVLISKVDVTDPVLMDELCPTVSVA
jgi:G3E family GTPase